MDEYFVRYFDFCVTGLIAFRPIFKRWSQRPTDGLCPIMRLCQQIFTVCASFKRYIIRMTHTYACVCVDVNSWVRSPCVSHPITEPQIDDNYEFLCRLWSPVVGGAVARGFQRVKHAKTALCWKFSGYEIWVRTLQQQQKCINSSKIVNSRNINLKVLSILYSLQCTKLSD